MKNEYNEDEAFARISAAVNDELSDGAWFAVLVDEAQSYIDSTSHKKNGRYKPDAHDLVVQWIDHAGEEVK